MNSGSRRLPVDNFWISKKHIDVTSCSEQYSYREVTGVQTCEIDSELSSKGQCWASTTRDFEWSVGTQRSTFGSSLWRDFGELRLASGTVEGRSPAPSTPGASTPGGAIGQRPIHCLGSCRVLGIDRAWNTRSGTDKVLFP